PLRAEAPAGARCRQPAPKSSRSRLSAFPDRTRRRRRSALPACPARRPGRPEWHNDFALEFYSLLRLNPGSEVMLGRPHFGDEISGVDQRRPGVTAGDDDMQPLATRLQRRDDVFNIEIVVAQRDVEFVKNNEAYCR